jgi:hypothetical protein
MASYTYTPLSQSNLSNVYKPMYLESLIQEHEALLICDHYTIFWDALERLGIRIQPLLHIASAAEGFVEELVFQNASAMSALEVSGEIDVVLAADVVSITWLDVLKARSRNWENAIGLTTKASRAIEKWRPVIAEAVVKKLEEITKAYESDLENGEPPPLALVERRGAPVNKSRAEKSPIQ